MGLPIHGKCSVEFRIRLKMLNATTAGNHAGAVDRMRFRGSVVTLLPIVKGIFGQVVHAGVDW